MDEAECGGERMESSPPSTTDEDGRSAELSTDEPTAGTPCCNVENGVVRIRVTLRWIDHEVGQPSTG